LHGFGDALFQFQFTQSFINAVK